MLSQRNPLGAEGGGFEPPVREPVRQFSKLLVSATHPSFQKDLGVRNRGVISLIAGAKVQLFFEPCKFSSNFFKFSLNFFHFCRSGIRDSNPRPSAWEANALPTELIPLDKKSQNCWCPDSEELERADSRTRTGDPRITNALLYQLSHIGNFSMISCSKAGAKIAIFSVTAKYFALKVYLSGIFLSGSLCRQRYPQVFRRPRYCRRGLHHQVPYR